MALVCPVSRSAGAAPCQHLGCGLEDLFGILREGYLLTFAKGEGEPWGQDSWVWPVGCVRGCVGLWAEK